MLITKLKIKNFRNYYNEEIEFNKNINIIFGDNAQGKTNILEAIFVSSIGKSFRTSKDRELININEKFSEIEMDYKKIDRVGKVKLILSEKKYIYLNGVKLKKLSELLGSVNVVTFIPSDINILKDGPAARRRFLDMMIGQLKPNYIYNLNIYLKVLEQRNNYLRQIKFENKNSELLDIWDEKLAEYAEKIFKYRNKYIEILKEKIGLIHKKITNNSEKISINYISQCKSIDKFKKDLRDSRNLDISKGYTTIGIHRDDFIISLDNKDAKIYGSQGQNRTAILTLKMAELQVIKDEVGEYPILLLDDFMSELDKKRIEKFIDNIEDIQVIITCTDKNDFLSKDKKEKFTFFQVKEGKIYRI